MTPFSFRPPWAAAALLALVAGCESAPRAGSVTTAQVLAVPRTRADLGGAHAHLHAALQAGVGRAAAERGRLVRGECGVPDPAEPDGVRWHQATTLLPEGVPAMPGSFLELTDLTSTAGGTRHHGRFVAQAAGPLALEPVRAAPGQRLRTACRPAATPGGSLRIRLLTTVAAWELDFAAAELQRHQRFRDTEIASGRVALLSCQLKVADGGDWYRPVWLARVPDGLDVRTGQVVSLRAGATEDSKDVEPLAQVIGVEAGQQPPGGNAVVRCR